MFTTIKIRKMFHEIPNFKFTKTLGEQTTRIRNKTFRVFLNPKKMNSEFTIALGEHSGKCVGPNKHTKPTKP
jgi:hypothetical protein